MMSLSGFLEKGTLLSAHKKSTSKTSWHSSLSIRKQIDERLFNTNGSVDLLLQNFDKVDFYKNQHS
jgi:hypothetical protein